MPKITVNDLINRLEKLPPNAVVVVLSECKACFKLVDEKPVKFYRLNTYDKTKERKTGFDCPRCGYLNANCEPNKIKVTK